MQVNQGSCRNIYGKYEKVKIESASRSVLSQLFATTWTVVCKAPLSMEFSRKKYWSGLPCPPPGDLPNPGIEHRSPALHPDSLPSEPPGKTRL